MDFSICQEEIAEKGNMLDSVVTGSNNEVHEASDEKLYH